MVPLTVPPAAQAPPITSLHTAMLPSASKVNDVTHNTRVVFVVDTLPGLESVLLNELNNLCWTGVSYTGTGVMTTDLVGSSGRGDEVKGGLSAEGREAEGGEAKGAEGERGKGEGGEGEGG
eukprot:GHVN01021147.1.p1 GENE.GHVN01021147.1~~GHVN01021147.1.p1  ORF type:complete len:121 (+),score=35.77 GHVN01021147.1:217-579(+)